MTHRFSRRRPPARFCGPALLLLAALACPAHGRASPPVTGDDHGQTLAALADIRAAVAEIVQAESSYATDKTRYYRSSHRAINALAGTHGTGYDEAAGSDGDAEGALGHIDALLDRQATPVWATPLHAAEANIRAAIAHLADATHAHELMDYEIAVSRALTYLKVAQGRPTETGAFGGLEGALANTVLGVPAGAATFDACAAPSAATPGYGTHDGYLAWISLPASDGRHVLAEDPGATDLTVKDGLIILHTAAAPLVATLCHDHAAAAPAATPAATRTEASATPTPAPNPAPSSAPSAPDPAATHAAAPADAPAGAPAGAPGGLPALYTAAQAREGQRLYTAHCVACHGADLQGTAAPSVAGTDFLTTAQHNGWSLKIVRYIVFRLMPRNAPSTLTPAESADVMAYLLASDCYPAGTKPFPATDDPAFADIHVGPVPGQVPNRNAKGVCPLP